MKFDIFSNIHSCTGET